MNWCARHKQRHRCREQGGTAWYMDTKGKSGEAGGGGCGMNWEIGIDMYTLICIKWITNKNLKKSGYMYMYN